MVETITLQGKQVALSLRAKHDVIELVGSLADGTYEQILAIIQPDGKLVRIGYSFTPGEGVTQVLPIE